MLTAGSATTTTTTGATTGGTETGSDPTESGAELTTGADAHDPKILFFSSRNGSEQLFWMNPDGSDQALLLDVDSQQHGGPVAWSPSGANVLFTRGGDVWRLHPESGAEENITDDPASDYLVDVSPDGTRVLFVSDRDSGQNLYLVPVGGGAAIRVTDETVEGHFVADFAPDGARIVHAFRPTAGAWRLSVTHLVTNTTDEIGAELEGSGFSAVAWSPDGSQIAVMANQGEESALYLMNPDGTGLTKIGTDGWQQVVWSPDGQSLVYRSGEGIAAIRRDGTGETLLVPNYCYYPDISPDSSTVVLTCFADGQDGRNIHTVPIAGGPLTQLTQDTVDNQIATWRP